MANASPCRALLVAEGSGGHLVPALQAGRVLAQAGAQVHLWYARRPQAAWAESLVAEAAAPGLTVTPIDVATPASCGVRARAARQLWQQAQAFFAAAATDVVAGFGGWVSAPVLLAARRQGIRCLLHEQNVMLGRTNRWLAPWMDRVALSFHETEAQLRRAPAIVTGLPVRPGLGEVSRAAAALHWGYDPAQPTVLVLGGSQGSRAVNQRVAGLLQGTDPAMLRRWQWLHVSGTADVALMRQAYAAAGVAAQVAAFCTDMAHAYAAADVVVGRAGASTLAELARCGVPAVFMPYPHAQGHQRANAALAQAVGGALVLEEAQSGPQQVFDALAMILQDPGKQSAMARHMRTLDSGDAARRLSTALLQLAQQESGHARSWRTIVN